MSILKLKPGFKDYIWGGHRLVEEYGKEFDFRKPKYRNASFPASMTYHISVFPYCPSFFSAYGKEFDGEILAESWELSCYPDTPSTIANGVHAGKTFR